MMQYIIKLMDRPQGDGVTAFNELTVHKVE